MPQLSRFSDLLSEAARAAHGLTADELPDGLGQLERLRAIFARGAAAWGAVALVGGFAMGGVYFVVLVLTLTQCWFSRKDNLNA